MNIAVEMLANLYDAFIGVYFILKFNKCRFSDKKLSLVFVALLFAVPTIFLYIDNFILLQTAIIFLLLFVFSFYINKELCLNTFLAPIIYELVLVLTSTLLIFFISILSSSSIFEISSGLSVQRLLFLILCKVVITSILLIIIRFFSFDAKFKPLDLMLYLLSPFMTVISLYTFITISLNENVEKYYVLIVISSFGLILVYSLTLLFFTRYLKSEQKQHELKLISTLNEQDKERYIETEKIYESVRIMRHDLNEQLAYAEQLYESGNIPDAKNHIEQIKKYVNDNYNTIHTGSRIIDNILYSKTSIHPDIRFIVTGQINDLSKINDMYIVSLFGNMIDNAIECTLSQELKVIEISFSCFSGYQNITCKNPINYSVLTENPNLMTTKKEKNLHGYGIKSMRETVNHLGGMIEFYEKDNQFYCHMAIPV